MHIQRTVIHGRRILEKRFEALMEKFSDGSVQLGSALQDMFLCNEMVSSYRGIIHSMQLYVYLSWLIKLLVYEFNYLSKYTVYDINIACFVQDICSET